LNQSIIRFKRGTSLSTSPTGRWDRAESPGAESHCVLVVGPCGRKRTRFSGKLAGPILTVNLASHWSLTTGIISRICSLSNLIWGSSCIGKDCHLTCTLQGNIIINSRERKFSIRDTSNSKSEKGSARSSFSLYTPPFCYSWYKVKQILPVLFLFLLYLAFPPTIFAQVVINEFSVNPPNRSDWIELYSSEVVDISDWIVADEAGDFFTIPSGTTLGSGIYYVFFKYQRLNNDRDTIYLKDNLGNPINTIRYGYEGEVCLPGTDGSIARIPDGGNIYDRLLANTKGTTNGEIITDYCPTSTPTPTLSPDPTASPTVTESTTPTQTPSPTPANSIYKINPAKDGNNQPLTGVKIYIDNLYTHHEDGETLEFCQGCFCDNDKQVSCELGPHTTKLTKAGYSDWSDQHHFSPGEDYEISPILSLIPTSGPTASSTQTPTTSPTKTPTPTKPTSTLPPKPSPSNQQPTTNNSPTSSPSSILGVSTSSSVINPSPEPTTLNPEPITNNSATKYTFIFGVIISSLAGGVLYFRHRND